MTVEQKMPRKLDEPIKMVGAYLLHVYCRNELDHDHDFLQRSEEYGAETRAKAISRARSYGWTIHADDTTTCPTCSKLLGLK